MIGELAIWVTKTFNLLAPNVREPCHTDMLQLLEIKLNDPDYCNTLYGLERRQLHVICGSDLYNLIPSTFVMILITFIYI